MELKIVSGFQFLVSALHSDVFQSNKILTMCFLYRINSVFSVSFLPRSSDLAENRGSQRCSVVGVMSALNGLRTTCFEIDLNQ